MLEVLAKFEERLPSLLHEDGWHSLLIDYHPPIVERLWRPLDGYRLSLHCIHPCESHQALFHPHPWPSAMRVLSGQYEMSIGYGTGDQPPPVAAKIIAEGGAFCYEMTDPDSWHYVRPIDAPVLTVMVTGPPWSRPAPTSPTPLHPLSASRKQELLQLFHSIYPSQR